MNDFIRLIKGKVRQAKLERTLSWARMLTLESATFYSSPRRHFIHLH